MTGRGEEAPPLDRRRVLEGLQTAAVAAEPDRLIYLAQVGSTNTEARERAAAGAAHGTVVVADEQTAGRGRLGRTWTVPARTGLTLSVVVRPAAGRGAAIVMATALAVHDLAVHDLGLAATLKWPNDLLLGGRKCCGILVETAGTGGALVAGIGLNVNATPPGLEERATCLAAARGALLEREGVLRALLRRLDATYAEAAAGGATTWRRWRDTLETLGQTVAVHLPDGGTVSGLAEEVTAEGALCVRDAAGRRHVLHAGDVSLSAPHLRR